MSHLSEKEIFAKTLYAEARGESEEGQIWVAWVIKNRAQMNREYWGGSTIKGVCLKPGQFECWNRKSDITVDDNESYQKICKLTDKIYGKHSSLDPTNGTDHYHNPVKEGHQPWVDNCTFVKRIGDHVFYKGP